MKDIPWYCVVIICLILGFVIERYVTIISESIEPKEPEVFMIKDGCTIYKSYVKGERIYTTKCKDVGI